MKIEGKVECEVEVKRFYMPGVMLSGECPKCKEAYERDFGQYYLSYPSVGNRFEQSCCCESCSHEWDVPLILTMSIAIVDDSGGSAQ